MGLWHIQRPIRDQDEAKAKAEFGKQVHQLCRRHLRVIVCGGRDYAEREALGATMDRLHRLRHLIEVIEGGACGADTMAGEWADSRGIKRTTIPADWKQYGRKAGPIRNLQMLELRPDGVVAFPGGRGTANMIAQARKNRVRVWEPMSI